jgi:glycosidase
VLGWEHAEDKPETIARAKQRLRLAFLFQAAYPGAPAIYYGDEVGVAGGPDPYNRATYPWPDLGGKPDMALHAEMQRLLALRRDHAVLRRGSLSAPLQLDDHVIVFAREGQGELVLVALNNADSAQMASFPLPAGTRATRFEDVLTGEVFNAQNGQLSLSVPALYGRMLLAR